jgi:glutamyl-tRNA reductase
MDLVVVGLSHRTAPIEVRERLVAPAAELPRRLEQLIRHAGVQEAALLTTCNRVEVYAAAADTGPAPPSVRQVLETWAERDLARHLYVHEGTAAVHHLFRVASSLDSMVVGEPQILGQVKDAFAAASAAGATGPLLSRSFHRAFQVAKRVRTETGVARAAVSMSAIAVELAQSIFEDLRGKRVLLCGAGEMAELAAHHMAGVGVEKILVANRSRERAEAVAAAVKGEAHTLDELGPLLEQADIVISSTGATSFIVTVAEARRVLKARRYRPLFLIDLAVPRDVDPRVGELSNVYLYDVDDLQQVADRNLAERSREAASAEELVAEEAKQFVGWVRSLQVVPTVVALREKCLAFARDEAARAVHRLGPLDDKQREAVERMAEAIVNKILHSPLTQLKREGQSGGAEMVDAVQRLFQLEVARGAEEPPLPEAKES